MISQLDVELFTEIPGVSPKPGRIQRLFSVTLAGLFRNRKDPGDDGQLFWLFTLFEREVEDFFRGKVESSNDLLILPEKRIVARGKPHQGCIPVFASVYLSTVGRAFPDKFANGFHDKFLRIPSDCDSLPCRHGSPSQKLEFTSTLQNFPKRTGLFPKSLIETFSIMTH